MYLKWSDIIKIYSGRYSIIKDIKIEAVFTDPTADFYSNSNGIMYFYYPSLLIEPVAAIPFLY